MLKRESRLKVEHVPTILRGQRLRIALGPLHHSAPTLDTPDKRTTDPVLVGSHRGRSYWAYQDLAYSTDRDDLTAADVRALATEGENRVKARLARAHAAEQLVTETSRGGREPIPDDVKMFVWQRDKGRCVRCESNRDLEFDHVIPLAMGGANTARNLQLLCAGCNRAKGASLA